MRLADDYSHVLSCDISDFYSRIYHHRLENALKRATNNTEVVRRIMKLLDRFSKNVSYGLPVGGPAARLLSELLLNRVDKLLLSKRITFCRYADDYHIYASTHDEAYGHLITLSQLLLENEGLTLNKAKTRILSCEEFLTTSEFSDRKRDAEDAFESEARRFMRLRLFYDQYSPTAAEDYNELKEKMAEFDVFSMLARELQKTRIHQTLTRRLIRAVAMLEPKLRNAAILSLMDNLPLLFPVFTTLMIVLKSVVADLDQPTKEKVFNSLSTLIRTESYIAKLPVNIAYIVRILAMDKSDETESLLAQVYDRSTSIMVKRDVILAMAKLGADYWISNLRGHYATLSTWEQRSILISSYMLNDEGDHWRKAVRRGLAQSEQLVLDWAADRKATGKWEIPL